MHTARSLLQRIEQARGSIWHRRQRHDGDHERHVFLGHASYVALASLESAARSPALLVLRHPIFRRKSPQVYRWRLRANHSRRWSLRRNDDLEIRSIGT